MKTEGLAIRRWFGERMEGQEVKVKVMDVEMVSQNSDLA